MPYLGALTLGLGVAQSSNVHAQESLEEVVVTASKRSENLQDLPMSVQAIGAAELDLKNVKGLDDIGWTLQFLEKIRSYERQANIEKPWLFIND